MSHMIDDNRFVLIEKYKQKLIEGTNISDRPEEMAVIDSILFRLWQMGWLDKLEQSEPHWIPVTERLPEINEDILLSYFDEVTIGWLCGDGSWMIFDGQECASADEISAWMPLPEPYKGVTE